MGTATECVRRADQNVEMFRIIIVVALVRVAFSGEVYQLCQCSLWKRNDDTKVGESWRAFNVHLISVDVHCMSSCSCCTGIDRCLVLSSRVHTLWCHGLFLRLAVRPLLTVTSFNIVVSPYL